MSVNEVLGGFASAKEEVAGCLARWVCNVPRSPVLVSPRSRSRRLSMPLVYPDCVQLRSAGQGCLRRVEGRLPTDLRLAVSRWRRGEELCDGGGRS
jgi:hypothetical protein